MDNIQVETGYPWEPAYHRLQEVVDLGTKWEWSDWYPLYDSIALGGLAAANTFVLNTQERAFFQSAIRSNDPSSGFGRAKSLAQTNLRGKGGEMPGGVSFIGKFLGILIDTDTPTHIVTQLLQNMAIQFDAQKIKTDYGAIRYWPQGGLGATSPSAVSNIAGDILTFAGNGMQAAIMEFPTGSELILPERREFAILLENDLPINYTTDGLPFDGENGLEGDLQIDCFMLGWWFNKVRPG